LIEDVGTLAYQAPEMLNGGEYDSRCDVWSLGCLLFSIVNLDMPFTANTKEKLTDKIKHLPHKKMDPETN
jgi:serine/threonine protein kinase